MIGVLVAAALVLITSSCVGSGKTARTETLEPFPSNIKVVADTTAGCKEGESGFDYRYTVVGPADLSAGSQLLEHVRSKGFFRTGNYLDDLPWVTAGYQHADYPLRVELGTLDRYINDNIPNTGPPLTLLPADVRADAQHYVLIAMRPTDFACSTPL